MRRIFGAVGVLCLAVCVATSVFAQNRVVVVADEWPPFSGKNLPGFGLSLDVTKTVLTRAGYDVETAVLPWARIVQRAKTGDYDIVTSLFPDKDLAQSLTYSDAFTETEIRFVQKKGAGLAVSDLDSLKPFSIAVGTGFLYENGFDHADHLDKHTVTTTLQGVRMVASGRLDLTLDSWHVLQHSIQVEDPTLADQVEILDTVLKRQTIHMAVSKIRPDHAQIVDDFNTTLNEMTQDGSLAILLAKHGAEPMK